jgi:50S ribosomal protein L16 3-hydroxylase
MRRHWQKRPLLVRRAWNPDVPPPIDRAGLFELAARDDVRSRVVQREPGVRATPKAGWSLRSGPFKRRQLPALSIPAWTLLVQGVDRQLDAAQAWLAPFRFIPDARLDDLMLSFATDGGGVGPHLDSYDVFLLQLSGRRRWRVGPVPQPRLVPGLPLKILQRFEPQDDWVLEPGDLLYVPPGWGHDGVAQGACITASVGFRAPSTDAFATELLQRCVEAHAAHEPADTDPLYADPGQAPTLSAAAIPPALQAHAEAAVRRWLGNPTELRARVQLALGEWLSEPHPDAWFEPMVAGPSSASSRSSQHAASGAGVRLDRRSRMAHDAQQIYLNGEAYTVRGRDAVLMRRLADQRCLSAADCQRLSAAAAATLQQWVEDGWLHDEHGDARPGTKKGTRP